MKGNVRSVVQRRYGLAGVMDALHPRAVARKLSDMFRTLWYVASDPRNIWKFVHEPKMIAVLMFFLYLVPIVGGYLTVLYPPTTVSELMGSELVNAWGWLMLIGGAISAIPALFGWWQIERLGMLVLTVTLFMYITTVVEAHVTTPGFRYTQLTWLVFGGFGLLLLRFLMTIAYRVDPRR